MSFQTATFSDTLLELLAAFVAMGTPVTDLRPGGILHGILTAVAVVATRQSEDAAQQVLDGQAAGAYAAFGFPLSPAVAATGTLTLTASPAPSADIAIPPGSLFGMPGTTIQFVSTAAATLSAGTTSVDLPIRCAQAGTLGNVPASAISAVLSSLPGITAATNAHPLTNGADQQREVDRAQAFRDYIATLGRTTKAAIETAATTVVVLDAFGVPVERVTKASLVENGAQATLAVFGDGDTASPTLVAATQFLVDGDPANAVAGYRAAGVAVTAVAATAVPVVTQVQVTLKAGANAAIVYPLVVDAVQHFFLVRQIGETLRLSALRAAIGAVGGIDSFVLVAPAFDLTLLPTAVVTLVPFQTQGAPPAADQSWVTTQ